LPLAIFLKQISKCGHLPRRYYQVPAFHQLVTEQSIPAIEVK
jgi:hypothetical protein